MKGIYRKVRAQGLLSRRRFMHRVPKLPLSQLRHAFIEDWYDGPLSGLILLRGKLYRFVMYDQADGYNPRWYRRFWIVKLNHQEVARARTGIRRHHTEVGESFPCAPHFRRRVTQSAHHPHPLYAERSPQYWAREQKRKGWYNPQPMKINVIAYFQE